MPHTQTVVSLMKVREPLKQVISARQIWKCGSPICLSGFAREKKICWQGRVIKRLIKSVDAFGMGNVVPVFVQGVEMAQPMVLKKLDGWNQL